MTKRGHFHRFLRMIMLGLTVIYGVATPMAPARSDDFAMDKCVGMLPYGRPFASNYSDVLDGKDYFTICHAGYVASFVAPVTTPRWIAYRLTSDQVTTCVPQKRPLPLLNASGQRYHPNPEDAFHSDEALPAAMRAVPADYTSNQDQYFGYEPLQLVPAEDFSTDPSAVADSFLLSNTVPQISQMMTYSWNFLEASIRSWARERGELIIYTGPVFAPFGRMMAPHIPLPIAVWKVVIDPQRHEAMAFLIQSVWIQGHLGYGELGYFQTSIGEVERWSHVELPLPKSIDRQAKSLMWPTTVGRTDAKHHLGRINCLENLAPVQ